MAVKAIKTCVKTDLSLNQIGTHSEYGIANVLEKCSPGMRAQLWINAFAENAECEINVASLALVAGTFQSTAKKSKIVDGNKG